jgi:hypothetical protein
MIYIDKELAELIIEDILVTVFIEEIVVAVVNPF